MRKIFLNIFLIFSGIAFTYGQSQELFVKAAYLEKFAMFTEWPETEEENEEPLFIIKVIGDRQYFKTISKFYTKHKIRNKTVKVSYVDDIKKIKSCHILFITEISPKKLNKIVEFTKETPILTVSDTKGYALSGVLINLFNVDNKIRFEINKKAVDNTGLVLSYHLLKFAKIVSSVRN